MSKYFHNKPLLIILVLLPLGYFLSMIPFFENNFQFLKLFAPVYFFLSLPAAAYFLFLAKKEKDFLVSVFKMLVIFFFVFTALAFIIITFFNISPKQTALFFSAVFLSISLAAILKIADYQKIDLSFKKIGEILKTHWSLFAAMILYLLSHALYFKFYIFIPEWDGYSYLIKIDNFIRSGALENYRPFFCLSAGILSLLMKISPYQLFSTVFVFLQSTIMLAAYKLLLKYEIKNKILQFSFLLGIVSIPVLAMEIDMTRPQNALFVFFPIYLFFLDRYLSEKNFGDFLFASLIAFLGPNYHEFFVFLLLVHLSLAALLLLKKYAKNNPSPRRILSAAFLFVFFVASLPLFFQKISFIQTILTTAKSISQKVLDVERWKMWFINDYWSDAENIPVGWPGLEGAAKYYGYYASPFVLLILALILFLLLKKNSWQDFEKPLVKISFAFFWLFLAFAEILPRLNYHYLPERFWVLIGLSAVFLAIPLLSYFCENKKRLNKTLAVVFLAAFIGLSGSAYVASRKKSLTSPEEYTAALWLKKNTPSDSLIVSQSANYPMINYFAQRRLFVPAESFFMSQELELETEPQKILEYEKLKNETIEEMRNDLNSYLRGAFFYDELDRRLRENKKKLDRYELNISRQIPEIKAPAFVLFSKDKFNTAYAQRKWWLKGNFYGANTAKFDYNLELVYSNKSVKIWKLK